jgi:hypothetical protein
MSLSASFSFNDADAGAPGTGTKRNFKTYIRSHSVSLRINNSEISSSTQVNCIFSTPKHRSTYS